MAAVACPVPGAHVHKSQPAELSSAETASMSAKRPREQDEEEGPEEDCETPAKQPRGAGVEAKRKACQQQSHSAVKGKAVLPEPMEPRAPPSAFALLAKQKWHHLVGEGKDRMEQAKLMWKALPANEKMELQLRAKARAEKHEEDKKAYEEALIKYKKSLPPAERAALKQKEKEQAQQQKAEAKQQAQKQKEKAKEYRRAVQDLGDHLKGSLQICKHGGMWVVPDGSVKFSNISLGLFCYMFGHLRQKMQPPDFNAKSGSVVATISGEDAGGVFGVSKIRGGSMYATHVIRRMMISYRPAQQQLTLEYQTDSF